MGNGTKKFELYIQAPHEVGILEYYIEYSVFEDSWTEFYPASIIQFEVTEPEESNRKIPSYPVLAIFLGVFVFIKLYNNLKLTPR